jgi:hypothetical protein
MVCPAAASLRQAKGETIMATKNHEGTTTLHLALAWGLVGIPLTLGVLQTLINAMQLFQ